MIFFQLGKKNAPEQLGKKTAPECLDNMLGNARRQCMCALFDIFFLR